MKKHNAVLSSTLLAASLLAGCGHAEVPVNTANPTSESKTPNTTPNEVHFSQEAQFLQAPRLAQLAIRNTKDYQTGSVAYHLIDMTSAEEPVDFERFRRTQTFITQIIAGLQPGEQDVTDSQGHITTITRRFIPSTANSHTYFFVDKSDIGVSALSHGTSVTKGDAVQTVSLISISDTPTTRLPQVSKKMSDIATEACQSEVVLQTRIPAEPWMSIMQEALCNGIGNGVAARQAGVSYEDYFNTYSHLNIDQNKRRTALYVMSRALYEATPS